MFDKKVVKSLEICNEPLKHGLISVGTSPETSDLSQVYSRASTLPADNLIEFAIENENTLKVSGKDKKKSKKGVHLSRAVSQAAAKQTECTICNRMVINDVRINADCSCRKLFCRDCYCEYNSSQLISTGHGASCLACGMQITNIFVTTGSSESYFDIRPLKLTDPLIRMLQCMSYIERSQVIGKVKVTFSEFCNSYYDINTDKKCCFKMLEHDKTSDFRAFIYLNNLESVTRSEVDHYFGAIKNCSIAVQKSEFASLKTNFINRELFHIRRGLKAQVQIMEFNRALTKILKPMRTIVHFMELSPLKLAELFELYWSIPTKYRYTLMGLNLAQKFFHECFGYLMAKKSSDKYGDYLRAVEYYTKSNTNKPIEDLE